MSFDSPGARKRANRSGEDHMSVVVEEKRPSSLSLSPRSQTYRKQSTQIPVLKGVSLTPATALRKLSLARRESETTYLQIIAGIKECDPLLIGDMDIVIDACLAACSQYEETISFTRTDCILLCIHMVTEQFSTVPREVFFREAVSRRHRYFIQRHRG